MFQVSLPKNCLSDLWWNKFAQKTFESQHFNQTNLIYPLSVSLRFVFYQPQLYRSSFCLDITLFITFCRLFKSHFAVKHFSCRLIWCVMILDSFMIFNQPITDCFDYFTLIISGSVITWASASSLKALTRESSFSLSKAHWEKKTDRCREKKKI